MLGVVLGAAIATLSAVDPHLAILFDHGVLRALCELPGRSLCPRRAVRAVLSFVEIIRSIISASYPHLAIEHETGVVHSGREGRAAGHFCPRVAIGAVPDVVLLL